jgi:GTPase
MKPNLIDQATFKVKAGNGGNGRVSFRHDPKKIKGGPDGGDGGNGGSIHLVTNPQIGTLKKFAGIDRFEAPHGGHGGKANRHGKNADDITIEIPVGTFVYEQQGKEKIEVADLSTPHQTFTIAKGGVGGRGNNALKSSRNTTPKIAEPGEKGERKLIHLELKILADVGLVGLPNVGKSSLLSVLTAARPEIANYPFTTLSPNLGVLETRNQKPETNHKTGHGSLVTGRSLVIADIPGLIEDAHAGKGLGIAFLKHIERCQALIYVLSPESDLLDQYYTVYHELKAFSPTMVEKSKLIVINKAELIDNQDEIREEFKQQQLDILFTSVYHSTGLEEIKKAMQALVA